MNITQVQILLNERKKEWTAIAQKTGLSRKTIERVAWNRTDPRVSVLQRIIDALA